MSEFQRLPKLREQIGNNKLSWNRAANSDPIFKLNLKQAGRNLVQIAGVKVFTELVAVDGPFCCSYPSVGDSSAPFTGLKYCMHTYLYSCVRA